jgi:hypothetical protein
MALKTMPIAKLQQLKSQVEAAISARVTERRRELESELSKLAGFGSRGKATKFGRGARMGPVAPKYRNPENPAETWNNLGTVPAEFGMSEVGSFCCVRNYSPMEARRVLNRLAARSHSC